METPSARLEIASVDGHQGLVAQVVSAGSTQVRSRVVQDCIGVYEMQQGSGEGGSERRSEGLKLQCEGQQHVACYSLSSSARGTSER